MTISVLHIKNIQRIALMLAVFVALTPCAVKKSLLTSFDIAFERPLNKTKTIQGISTVCESEVFSHIQTESNTKIAAINIPTETPATPIILVGCKKVALKKYAKKASGNSPPLYLLFKRFKLDMV